MFQVDILPIQTIPIKIAPHEKQNRVIKLVNKILDITKNDKYMQNTNNQSKMNPIEAEINQLVYELYDLTPNEIKIVESENENAN